MQQLLCTQGLHQALFMIFILRVNSLGYEHLEALSIWTKVTAHKGQSQFSNHRVLKLSSDNNGQTSLATTTLWVLMQELGLLH